MWVKNAGSRGVEFLYLFIKDLLVDGAKLSQYEAEMTWRHGGLLWITGRYSCLYEPVFFFFFSGACLSSNDLRCILHPSAERCVWCVKIWWRPAGKMDRARARMFFLAKKWGTHHGLSSFNSETMDIGSQVRSNQTEADFRLDKWIWLPLNNQSLVP